MSSPQELRSALAAGAPLQAISKSKISLALTKAPLHAKRQRKGVDGSWFSLPMTGADSVRGGARPPSMWTSWRSIVRLVAKAEMLKTTSTRCKMANKKHF